MTMFSGGDGTGSEAMASVPEVSKASPHQPEGMEVIEMNNFYHYFPDGMFRENFRKVGYEKRTEIMEAIDEMIAGEFKDQGFDDIARIIIDLQNQIQVHTDRFVKLFNTGVDIDSLDRTEVNVLNQELKELNESLRPIFEALLKRGFTANQLAHGQ